MLLPAEVVRHLVVVDASAGGHVLAALDSTAAAGARSDRRTADRTRSRREVLTPAAADLVSQDAADQAADDGAADVVADDAVALDPATLTPVGGIHRANRSHVGLMDPLARAPVVVVHRHRGGRRVTPFLDLHRAPDRPHRRNPVV